MPLKSYGVLKGKVIQVRLGAGQSPHYQVYIVDDTTDYRIAINVKSKLSPSELEYLIIENFQHPLTSIIAMLPRGFTPLDKKPGSGALDYIRGNLLDRSLMRPLPFSVPGFDNDLNEKIDSIMQRALADETAIVYAFGERWGPEPDRKDRFFGFLPGNGIHDIHMNQGNVGDYVRDDGVWQDGGLLVNFPDQNFWIGIFLKFQSQTWHTDDATGHRIGVPIPAVPPGGIAIPTAPAAGNLPTADEPHGLVRIVAALVNSVDSPEVEFVTLLNTAPQELLLDGWAIVDTQKQRLELEGAISPGGTRVFKIERPLALSNRGGVITLLNKPGLKVHGVSYTMEQAQNPGWTIAFG